MDADGRLPRHVPARTVPSVDDGQRLRDDALLVGVSGRDDRDVGRALRVHKALETLPQPDRAITPDEFAREWTAFLARVQGDL